MIARWHLLTGEYPPDGGGIAQHVSVMALALAGRGANVHVWTPTPAPCHTAAGVTVHQLPDHFGPRTVAALDRGFDELPGRIVLHYAPNALGHRGANLRFCRWLAARGQQKSDARVLFHEPFMYFGRQSIARNALAVLHRVMAAALLRVNEEVYLSTPSWQRLLERYCSRQHRWKWIPITAGSAPRASAALVSNMRVKLCCDAKFLVGAFGTYARETTGVLRKAIMATLAACPDAHVVCLGRNSCEFAASIPDRARMSATGELTDEELSAAIAACDVMLQPFPEGATGRRTSLLRSVAAGAAIVTTSGKYTEPFWHTSGAVALAPAGDPGRIAASVAALLADPAARLQRGESARQFYESSFSAAALINALDPADQNAVVPTGSDTHNASGGSARR